MCVCLLVKFNLYYMSTLILPDNIYEYVKKFETILDDELEKLKQYFCDLEHVKMNYIEGETKMSVSNTYYNIRLLTRNDIYEFFLVSNVISSIYYMRTNEDIESIVNKSELVKFPININDQYEILLGETLPLLHNNTTNETTNLNVVAMYSSPNKSHEPLYEYKDYMTRDKWMKLTIDNLDEGLHAFLLARFAWGLNICVAIFDEATQTLYHWESDNYDYPTGIAVRKTCDKIEIYLDVDGRSPKETMYENELLQDKEQYDLSLDWDYSSQWITYDFEIDFSRLKEYIKICKERSNKNTITPYYEYCENIEKTTIKLFEQKQYLEALNLYETLFVINQRLQMDEDMRLVMNRCEFKLMAYPESPEIKEEIIEKLLMILQTPSHSSFEFGNKQCIKELKENCNYAELITDIRIVKYLV